MNYKKQNTRKWLLLSFAIMTSIVGFAQCPPEQLNTLLLVNSNGSTTPAPDTIRACVGDTFRFAWTGFDGTITEQGGGGDTTIINGTQVWRTVYINNSNPVIVGSGSVIGNYLIKEVYLIDMGWTPGLPCRTTQVDSVVIITPYPPTPSICLVTVDETTGKNQVVLEPSVGTLYNIYKQNNTTSSWRKIASAFSCQ